MGFSPDRYVLFKSLVGDSADNIMGVNGIGKKRGAEIVNQIDSIDDIVSSEAKPKYINAILENIDIVKRNIKLIELRYREEISLELFDLSFSNEKASLRNSEILSACNIFD